MTDSQPAPAPSRTKRYFGTDGIRAPFGTAPLDRSTVDAIGRALANLVASGGFDHKGTVERRRVLIAGDTRQSTPTLAAWLTAGLRAADPDMEIVFGGTLPTPALAVLGQRLQADLSIALSASHNPFQDNGIKVFRHDGFKPSDRQELEIETLIDQALADSEDGPVAAGSVPPQISADLQQQYLDHLASDAPTLDLHVVLDAGNGAASALAGPLFERLGARVDVLNAEPDGTNINHECGSTAPGHAAEAVISASADLGFAFDGDADRVIVIDERGAVRDGDEILFLWAQYLQRKGALPSQAIVATSMSNLGLEHALERIGVAVERCDVGDRAVVSMLREKGLRLGGEQSGHLVDLEHHTTGDGLATAIAISRIVRASRRPLSESLQDFRRFPQRLINVAVESKPAFERVPEIARAARDIEQELGSRGRLVLRYSGTEALARVMVEAEDQATVDRTSKALASIIEQELG